MTGNGQGEHLLRHTKGRLKSEDSGLMTGVQTEETPDTLRLSRQKVKGTKIGNIPISQVSRTDTHDLFTDHDAVEIFNRVVLKNRDPIITRFCNI